MFRLLKAFFITSAMAADTCSNKEDEGECPDDSSVLQIHRQEAQRLTHFSEVDQSSVEYPEPSQACDGFFAKPFFEAAPDLINGIIADEMADKQDITEPIYTHSTRVWKNWITKCETDANLTVTGTVGGVNTAKVTELQCIETNAIPTKWTAVVTLTMTHLSFQGTGSFQIVREKANDKKCLIGSLPKTAATVGATADNVTVTALVSVEDLKKVTNVTDVIFMADEINQLKCGAMSAPIDLSFMNKICDAFLGPLVDIFKKPIIQMVNKAINNFVDKKYNPENSSMPPPH